MDLISIIVPIFNVEKYLKQCLNSIINQTYRNLEIILVDDGSPDNCGSICDEYAKQDSRIKVIHKNNGGLSSARNSGLDIANGEYISFIDSDDYVAENFIETLYKLCKDNSVEIAECGFLRFPNDNKDKQEEKKEIKIFNKIEKIKHLYDINLATRTVVVWNKLYKRNIYKDIRFPEGKINEDEFTTYKALYKCEKNIAITNEKLYYYRYNEESIMGRSFNIKRLALLDALKERRDFFIKNNEKDLFDLTVIYYQHYLYEYFFLVKDYIDKPYKYLKKIKKELKINVEDYINTDYYEEDKKRMIYFSKFHFLYNILYKEKKLYISIL